MPREFITEQEALNVLVRKPGGPTIGAVTTNPVLGAVIADDGAVPADGDYAFEVYVTSSVAAAFDVERRNAANTATVDTIRVNLPASDSLNPPLRLVRSLLLNERIRVVTPAAITGVVQGLIKRVRVDEP